MRRIKFENIGISSLSPVEDTNIGFVPVQLKLIFFSFTFTQMQDMEIFHYSGGKLLPGSN